jgi:hypothetical protein
MRTCPKVFLLLAILATTFSASGQELSPADAVLNDVVLNTVTISTPVYFRDSEGQNVLVPAGSYWVTPGAETLELFRLDDSEIFNVQASVGEHSEDFAEPFALSTPGTDEQPDIHSVAYMNIDGTQLVAEGSYSGIQARGLLSDAAKQKAAAARAAAQRAAAETKRRAQGAAAEARRRAEQVAAAARHKARSEIGEMLQDIANTEYREGHAKAIAKAARYAPRLAVMGPASLSLQEKAELLRAARRELENRAPFIKEVIQRATTIVPLLRDGRKPLSASELQNVRNTIFGSGENELRHPFAGPVVKARGIGDGINPSFSVGASGEISAIAGLSIGAAQSFPFNPLTPGSCTYISAAVDLGLQGEGEVMGNIGFFAEGHETLGGSLDDGPKSLLGGIELAVNLGGSFFVGVDVVLLFGIPTDALPFWRLTGIQVGFGGGAGGEAAVGIGYGLRVLCI